MKQMSQAAVERAMKLQDVMLRAMAKRINVVSGGRDPGDQLPADATLEDPV
jgi:predicted transcriptional regulator